MSNYSRRSLKQLQKGPAAEDVSHLARQQILAEVKQLHQAHNKENMIHKYISDYEQRNNQGSGKKYQTQQYQTEQPPLQQVGTMPFTPNQTQPFIYPLTIPTSGFGVSNQTTPMKEPVTYRTSYTNQSAACTSASQQQYVNLDVNAYQQMAMELRRLQMQEQQRHAVAMQQQTSNYMSGSMHQMQEQYAPPVQPQVYMHQPYQMMP